MGQHEALQKLNPPYITISPLQMLTYISRQFEIFRRTGFFYSARVP